MPTFFADLTAAERAALFSDAGLRTLPAAFAAIPDPRQRRGQRYDLPYLLPCLAAALLCDCTSWEALGRWTRDQHAVLRRGFPRHRFHTPTGALYRRLLPRVSAAHVERALATWVRQTRPLRDREPLASAGKTGRGARTARQVAPHLLSVSTHTTPETLVQVRVDDTTNEIPVAQERVPHRAVRGRGAQERVPHRAVRGRGVTAEALPTQTALAHLLLAPGATSLLLAPGATSLCTVKDHQPRLHAELAAYFADCQATARTAQTIDRRRGRTETRTLAASTRLNAYLRRYFAFPRIAPGARVIRTVRTAAQTTTEVV